MFLQMFPKLIYTMFSRQKFCENIASFPGKNMRKKTIASLSDEMSAHSAAR